MNNLNKEYIAKKIEDQYIVPNGHSIMASWLYDGFDIEHLIGDHHSDTSSIKSTIYDNDGNVLDKVDGVNNLSFLFWLADELKLEYVTYFGRGSQARELFEVIKTWSESSDDESK